MTLGSAGEKGLTGRLARAVLGLLFVVLLAVAAGGASAAAGQMRVMLAQAAAGPAGAAAAGDAAKDGRGQKQKATEGREASPQGPAAGSGAEPLRSDAFNDLKLKISKVERLLPEVRRQLDEARQTLSRPDLDMEALGRLRGRLDALRLDLLAQQKELAEPVERVKQQLAALGPPPGEGQEDPAIAARRKALEDMRNRLQAADRKLSLLVVEARQLAEKAADRQRRLFFSGIFKPSRSVLNPLLWMDGLATVPDLFVRLKVLVQGWLSRGEHGSWLLLALTMAFVASFLLLMHVWRRWRRPLESGARLDDLRRLWRAVRVAVYSAIVLILLLVALNVAVYVLGGPMPRMQRLLDAIGMGLLFAVIATAMARGIFRPEASALRLVDIDDQGARVAYRLAAAIAFLQAFYRIVDALAEVLFLPVSFSVFWSAVISILQLVLIALFLVRVRQAAPLSGETAGEATGGDGEGQRFFFVWARYVMHVVWLLLVVTFLALLMGYIALARFIISQTVTTTVLVAGLYLLHHLADAAVRNALDGRTYTGQFLRRTLGLPERTITQLGVLFSTLVDIGIVFVGLPVVLMQWAVNWVDLATWARAAFFGFKVGNITIEPAAILLGVVVLIIGLLLTKLLVLWLDRRVLARTGIDEGVRHSLVTTAKYTLTIVSALVALSVAGVNFSSLALIGGALGVGIGFGLQSIVNNFVSGLILLAERPIKVGDWIKVSGGEGVVRKIRVRSTEIETFDRCSIIVPNSSLISEPVSNWYHSSRMGRLRLAVGVSYDSDPDEVERILLRCANSHPRALANPKPFVLFTGFGDNSLDFELRVYIDDAGYLASTASDLRFAIFRAFRQAGIEIPFPQRDVHIRSLPPEMFDRGELPPEEWKGTRAAPAEPEGEKGKGEPEKS
jgi:small-conductance mechanosensitive channel